TRSRRTRLVSLPRSCHIGAAGSEERAVFDLTAARSAATLGIQLERCTTDNAVDASYRGPERRRATGSSLTALLAATLDEIDYGMLLVVDGLHLLHANHVARAELDAEHPIQLLGHKLRAREPQDVAPLHGALTDACRHRLRRMVTLGEGRQRVSL